MGKTLESSEVVIHAYRKRARRYNLQVRLFDLFSAFGFNKKFWMGFFYLAAGTRG